jgi:transcriptional regulator with XRE-family HTH domain
MANPAKRKSLDFERSKIAKEIRALRLERRWTQAGLAERLGLSQNRLSEIERGDGSFTAEQFLRVLRLFNVDLRRFAPEKEDHDAALQNALARFGATELHESGDVLPTDEHSDVAAVVREALAGGVPRFLTALAPVLVRNVDRLRLNKLFVDLRDAGLENRLGWVVENTVEAARAELAAGAPPKWAQLCRRAELLLKSVLLAIPVPTTPTTELLPEVLDLIDPSIRSEQSLKEVRAGASDISRKWKVVSGLQPQDFLRALRAARVED